MNEHNVKIQIHEVNNTSPAGLPTDSTDIAFIPGFANPKTATKVDKWAPVLDTPVLCTTVEEFEANFGSTPYKLTKGDVDKYSTLGFVAGESDRSYVFAKELIYSGMPVIYVAMGIPESGYALDAFYEGSSPAVKKFYQMLEDKGNYSVKYITSGGYPSVIKSGPDAEGKVTFTAKFAGDMLSCAANRGDAVALIDYQLDKDISSDEFYKEISEMSFENTDFGALMYPWAHYNLVNTLESDITMPASYAYLSCVARAVKSSPNWYAMAGVSRGLVKGVKSLCTDTQIVTNKSAEDMQPKYNGKLSVNCITDIKPYGLCIWGNRTMRPVNAAGCDALNFLNTRNMLSDIKKVLFTTAKYLMFEQNSDTLWLRFKAGVSPLLNQLKQGNGISDFKIIKSNIRHDGTRCGKGELAAIIRIYPIHAVEYFDLTVDIRDDDVIVEGE